MESPGIFILGAPRSGTSMVAGTVAHPDFHIGESLIPADSDNPKGYFETVQINRINERIIGPVTHEFPRLICRNLKGAGPLIRRWLFPSFTEMGLRVFAYIPLRKDIPPPSSSDENLIKSIVQNRPFLYKDPRFCYTLPHWRTFAPRSKVIVVFRDPITTAQSMIEYAKENSSDDFTMTVQQSLYIINNMYTRILNYRGDDSREQDSKWCFVHQEQVLAGTAFDCLESFTGKPVNRDFPDPSLTRSEPESQDLPGPVQETYRRLCTIAGFNPDLQHSYGSLLEN